LPNYKTFQDYADSLRVRVYGADSSGTVSSILTDASGKMNITGDVGVSGNVGVSGTVAVSGNVGVSGTVGVSGAVEISGNVGVSGTVAVSGNVGVSGTVGVSGAVEISGNVGVSGTVAVSGNVGVSGTVGVSGAVEISGNVGVSGTVAISGTVDTSGWVSNSGALPLYVNLYARNTVDSGPVTAPWSGSSSGTADGVWDVLGYNSWTLAVQFSGTSGEAVSAKLQMSVIGSGESTWVDQDVYKNFSGTSWNFYTTNYHVRYARMWGQNTSTTDSGALLVYFQAEY